MGSLGWAFECFEFGLGEGFDVVVACGFDEVAQD